MLPYNRGKAMKIHIVCVCVRERERERERVALVKIFPHYLIKGTIFGGGDNEHKKCILIFSVTFI